MFNLTNARQYKLSLFFLFWLVRTEPKKKRRWHYAAVIKKETSPVRYEDLFSLQEI